ncbi:MAG: 30S ribosomal protein S21 [Firmicutes bacterium]|nr:30S ribosomal protein S21 [Bacillota bacterium]
MTVTVVRIQRDESFDKALKRFKRECRRTGLMSEMKRRESYEKPSVRRKKKAEAARKKKRLRNPF